jgi:hypothetical protein
MNIVIIESTGIKKSLAIKEFKVEDLYKKCGFKKPDDFKVQTEWNNIQVNDKIMSVKVFAKDKGRANNENKYDFPPPIDHKLFYGSCALVASVKDESGVFKHTNLTVSLWETIYEILFGGFENLKDTEEEDEDEEEEEDENIVKTKTGYEKDGFVVDDDDSELSEEPYIE